MIGTKEFEEYCNSNFKVSIKELEALYSMDDKVDTTFPLTIRWVLNFIRYLNEKPIYVLATMISNNVDIDDLIRDVFAFVDEYKRANGEIPLPRFGRPPAKAVSLVRRIATAFFNNREDAIINAALLQFMTEKYLDTLPDGHEDRDVFGDVKSMELCDALDGISFNVIEVPEEDFDAVKSPNARLN